MKPLIFLFFLFSSVHVFCQPSNNIIAGPMLGHTDLRTAIVWYEMSSDIKEATLVYHNVKNKSAEKQLTLALTGGQFNTAEFTLTGLDPGTTYVYGVTFDKQSQPIITDTLTTQQLWQWHQPAPDFSFITGSCAYFNEPAYDRPGKPFGGDSSIFETMAKEKASFTLWLGDNWYTRDADYFSKWGLFYRASRDRSLPELQTLLARMPHYAIWDDHDYGPNDADKSYILKETSREVFTKYWANPSYGFNGQGVYSKVTWNDVDVFMLDDRWFRSNDKMLDSINGKPNTEKKMFGAEQLEWLKNSLLFSNANSQISFRIIATGSQVLNSYSPYDCFRHFPAEYNELLDFIALYKIKGVLFLTGDRHHSEIIKLDRPNNYPLYDITVSPFTSGVAKTSGKEANNPTRVGLEIDQPNYARFTFSGKNSGRELKITFLGLKGEELSVFSVKSGDLIHGKKK